MNRPFSYFAWSTLAYTVGVILWGAWVRATGSGAGCGSHWPLCNGEILPRSEQAAELIEFTHRATSGIALILVVVLVIWAFRAFPERHIVRLGAVLTLLFMLLEAAIGAGLVLFELVGENASFTRAWVMALHLLNTFMLLGALSLTAWFSSDGEIRRNTDSSLFIPILSVGALLLLGASGAVTALGDTLFPASSLQEALRADFSPSAHFLIRLRVYHPLLALITSVIVVYSCVWCVRRQPTLQTLQLATATIVLIGLQIVVGFINVWLLAPAWLQIVHLLLSDLIWIGFLLLLAVSLTTDRVSVDTRIVKQSGGSSWKEPDPAPR